MSGQTPFNRKDIVSGLPGASGGFIMGILGNLVAAWVQQDGLKNQFGTVNIMIILGLTVVGLLLSVWWSHRHAAAAEPSPENSLTEVDVTKGSQLHIKGKGNRLQRVKADNHSTIDIES